MKTMKWKYVWNHDSNNLKWYFYLSLKISTNQNKLLIDL